MVAHDVAPHPVLSLDVPLVFAHRGGSKLRPENTLLSFDHGLSLGADGLEFDVRLSRDGVPMVHHDETLDRTTSGSGPLSSLSADQLQALDAGHRTSVSPKPATPCAKSVRSSACASGASPMPSCAPRATAAAR